MKNLMALSAALALVGSAQAVNVTNYVTDGQFESPNGDVGPWLNQFGGDTILFLSAGGNPDGCAQIADAGSFGGFAYVNPPSLTLSSLGLVAGQSYTFVMDMRIDSGASIGGLKIESWNATTGIGNSGDLRPPSGTGSWATYSFNYTIAPTATHLNIVPLWGPNSTVQYDNIGVIVPVGTTPVSVSLSSPTNSQVVYSNFLISANATVFPGTVTNVGFYVDGVLVGNDTSSPFNFYATGVGAGAHTLRAVARDSGGIAATSAVVNISVTSAPLPPVSVYEPFNYSLGEFANGTASTATGFSGNWTMPSGAGNIVDNLTQLGLPTANNALQQANNGSGRSFVNFASPLASGTKYVSFLVRNSFDTGGNWAGIFLKGDNTTSLFAGFRAGVSANLTGFGLGSVNSSSASPTAGAALGGTVALENTNTHLIVLRINFNTSGANDTVSFWANPPVATNDPGTTANATVTTFDVGNIAGIGLNLQGGSPTLTLDEIRVGETYADVVGGSLTPTVPTTLMLAIGEARKVSWSAASTNYYRPQKSPDSSSWTDLGDVLFGSGVTSVFDTAPEAFYQVLEMAPIATEQIVDGGFETDGGSGTAFYWTGLGSLPPTRITSDFHTGEACMSLFVTNVDLTAKTSDLQQNLFFVGGPAIIGGNTYSFSFWAKSLGKNPAGGYVQQYKVSWLNASSAVVGSVGFTAFSAGTNDWLQINTGPVVAPASAVNALIEIFVATGGIANDYGGVLIDDMSLTGLSPGDVINVLSPTVQAGAVFTATVKSNGVVAAAATGTVQFTTNNIGQGLKAVTDGVAVSDPSVVPAAYTVKATYSGDATFIGSTATLVVGSTVNTTPTNIVSSVSGNQLTLSWPASHIGWNLQTQTNSRSVGLSNAWFDVSGSTTTNQMTFTVSPANPTVFYRLRYAP
jgi:hypothetical protein